MSCFLKHLRRNGASVRLAYLYADVPRAWGSRYGVNLLIIARWSMTVPPEILIRFMQLVRVAESACSLQALDPIERSLLRIIILANSNNERLSVKDLMNSSGLASPATTHKHIHAMVAKEWIELAPTEDQRRKQIQLTSRAWKHFDKIGKAAVEATSK